MASQHHIVASLSITYIIICFAQLMYRIGSHSSITESFSRTEQLQSIVHLHLRPHRKQRLDGLLHLAEITPHDRLEEFRQGSFVPREIESELPDEISLRRSESSGRRIRQNVLFDTSASMQEGPNQNLRSAHPESWRWVSVHDPAGRCDDS